jgi:uncharacterized membrane protein
MKHKLKYNILLVIFLIALGSSIVLSFVPLPLICTQLEGCNAVQTSSYSKTLGIENSYFGIAIFFIMSITIYLHIHKPNKKKEFMINVAVFLGAMIALYFIYLQQFVLHAYCKYCLVVDIGMVICFVIINIQTDEKNKVKFKEEHDRKNP